MPPRQNSLPTVVISLDFELRWGVHDIYGLDADACRADFEKTRQTIPRLLQLFEDYRVRATWATVGALGCEGWDEYFRRAPTPPKYTLPGFAVKHDYARIDPHGSMHFAPELVRSILACPGQELGTHTFSHLYLRERGITAQDVAADLAAVSALYRDRYGTLPVSLVFPRNQPGFLEVVRSSSIRIWRGNPRRWYYEREDSENNGLVSRALKLADALNPACRLAAPLAQDMTQASIFLRLSLPGLLWSAHLRRIAAELKALAPDDIYHVWFHPESLGRDTAQRLARTEQVLDLIARRQSSGRLRSCTMSDLVH